MADLRAKRFNYSLEGLRGICALTVALAHVQTGMILFPTLHPVVEYSHFAHLAVLVFFMLSGYVIGVNYPGEHFSKKDYLVKRLFRIYPIYLIVILFCFAIEPNLTPSKVIGAVFLFQGWTEGLLTNVVLWTIHYEIIFYLLFVIIGKSKRAIVLQGIVCLLIGLAVWAMPNVPQIFGGYFCGFAFWLTGLYISKLDSHENVHTRHALFCLLALLMVYNHLAPGGIFLNGIGLKNGGAEIVSAADIINMVPCFLMIVEAGNININKRILNALYAVALGFPAIIIGLLVYTHRLQENFRWQFAAIMLCIAFVLFFIKQGNSLLTKISALGGISYSIYIVHWPIGFLLGQVFSPTSVTGRVGLFVLWLVLVFTISWLLEKKFQIFLKHRFFPRKPAGHPPVQVMQKA